MRDEQMRELYDQIGVGYGTVRHPDPRIAAAVVRALDRAATVVNVGAGAGSYEPSDRRVVAVEPSLTMIRQRRAGSAPVVQGSAAELPFRDAAFTAALAILTVHHWRDRARGLDVRQDPRGRARPGEARSGAGRRDLGAPIRQSPRPLGARPRIPPRHLNSTWRKEPSVSTPRSATSARSEVRQVAPKLIELSE